MKRKRPIVGDSSNFELLEIRWDFSSAKRSPFMGFDKKISLVDADDLDEALNLNPKLIPYKHFIVSVKIIPYKWFSDENMHDNGWWHAFDNVTYFSG